MRSRGAVGCRKDDAVNILGGMDTLSEGRVTLGRAGHIGADDQTDGNVQEMGHRLRVPVLQPDT